MPGRLRENRNRVSKIGIYVAFLVIVLLFCGIWAWNHTDISTTANAAANAVAKSVNRAGEALERVVFVPSSTANGAAAKALVDVQHEFKDGSFSADVSASTKNELKRYGNVKPVEQLRIPEPKGEKASGKPGAGRTCSPSVQKPWGVAKINGGSGGGATVAILDTGVANHADLKISLCMDTTKRKIASGCADQNGHGTHVAGIVAANGGKDGKGIYGVAPDANMWIIKVCKADGTCWADDITEGIYYAVDNGANIISMSFGANTDVQLIRDAINYGVQHGVLFVASAGNDGPTDGSIDWPAANAKVIAVGAIDSTDTVPSWSSRGINYQTTPWSVEEGDIEFAAPGVSIESTWIDGCYRILSGTSMAAPHVTGLAAKLWQGSAAATREYLQYIAQYYYSDIGRAGDDPDAGFGLPVATG